VFGQQLIEHRYKVCSVNYGRQRKIVVEWNTFFSIS